MLSVKLCQRRVSKVLKEDKFIENNIQENQTITVMLPRIHQIISVTPYKVICLWNTGEIREIDLQPLLTDSIMRPNSPVNRLFNKELFYAGENRRTNVILG